MHFELDGQSYHLEAYASRQATNTTKCFTADDRNLVSQFKGKPGVFPEAFE